MTGRDDGCLLHLTLMSTDDAAERIEGVRLAAEGLLAALGAPGVELVASTAVHCDSCGDDAPEADTPTEALAVAASLGWGHSPDGSDWCPSCWTEAKP